MSSKLTRLVGVFFIAAVALFAIACGNHDNNNGNCSIIPTGPGCPPTTRHFTMLEYDRDTSPPFFPDKVNDLAGLQLTIWHRILQNNAWTWQVEAVFSGNAMTVVNSNPGVYTMVLNRDWPIGDQYRFMVSDPGKMNRVAHTLILDGIRLTPTTLPSEDGVGTYEVAYYTVSAQ